MAFFRHEQPAERDLWCRSNHSCSPDLNELVKSHKFMALTDLKKDLDTSSDYLISASQFHSMIKGAIFKIKYEAERTEVE